MLPDPRKPDPLSIFRRSKSSPRRKNSIIRKLLKVSQLRHRLLREVDETDDLRNKLQAEKLTSNPRLNFC